MSPRQRARRRLAWRLITVAAFMVVALTALLGGVVAGVYSSMMEVLPAPGDITGIRPAEGAKIYSGDGVLLGRVAKEHREFLSVTEIPTELQLASIAVEDRRFYQHHGVDPKGIVAAIRDNVLGGRIVRGASTITQQLARNVYLSPKRTFGRKLQEMILALQIERTYSKEEILELYLNQMYYGNGAYGVRVAAETYFDKPVQKLDLAQCALLAGIPQRPNDFNPFLDPDAATVRRDEVLRKMRDEGYVTAAEADKAVEQPLGLGEPKRPLGLSEYKAPYFTNYVLHELVQEHGADAIYRGNLKIYTTLDWKMQEAAERAVRDGVRRAKPLHVSEGALIALDYRTGAVKALVGGLDFNKDQYSCATQARRQAGSAFKPFVYTAAMDAGFTPDTIMVDEPVSYRGAGGKPWRPKNADRKHRGSITLRNALVHSVNVIAVKLADEVGIDKVVACAHRMGIRDPLDPYLSLALGTSGVTALDMASAFGVFANGGRRAEPRAVERITDFNDSALVTYRPETHQVLSEATAAVMDDILQDVIRRGTGHRARIKWHAAGKTGTASDYKDAWFIGYTNELVCAVWVGNRDNSPMRRVFGGTVPAPIWADFMTQAMQIIEKRNPARARRDEERPARQEPTTREGEPETGPVRVRVCLDSNKLARPECPNTGVVEYPPEQRGAVPRVSCDLHGPGSQGAPEVAGAITLSVCSESGKLATEHCPSVVNRRFAPRDAPTTSCSIHKPPPGSDLDEVLW
ncbi:MAG: penicillin-binding protein 1A [Armatimonadota bacterium]|nr:MAG: penicillin-binding protein 1A [Armatimonadota bacterium]